MDREVIAYHADAAELDRNVADRRLIEAGHAVARVPRAALRAGIHIRHRDFLHQDVAGVDI
jgi:hypothetical protein